MNRHFSIMIEADPAPVYVQHDLGTERIFVVIFSVDTHEVLSGPFWLQDGPDGIVFPSGLEIDCEIVIAADNGDN